MGGGDHVSLYSVYTFQMCSLTLVLSLDCTGFGWGLAWIDRVGVFFVGASDRNIIRCIHIFIYFYTFIGSERGSTKNLFLIKQNLISSCPFCSGFWKGGRVLFRL